MQEELITAIPPMQEHPRPPEHPGNGTGRFKGQGELVLNEIVCLLFPNGQEVQNLDEFNLRLQMLPGILYRYGYGPKKV